MKARKLYECNGTACQCSCCLHVSPHAWRSTCAGGNCQYTKRKVRCFPEPCRAGTKISGKFRACERPVGHSGRHGARYGGKWRYWPREEAAWASRVHYWPRVEA